MDECQKPFFIHRLSITLNSPAWRPGLLSPAQQYGGKIATQVGHGVLGPGNEGRLAAPVSAGPAPLEVQRRVLAERLLRLHELRVIVGPIHRRVGMDLNLLAAFQGLA